MAWKLFGNVKSRSAIGDPIYHFEVGGNYDYSHSFNATPAWLSSAECFMSVSEIATADTLLRDFGKDPSTAVPVGGSSKDGLCWIKYSSKDKILDIVLGLRESDFETMRNSLDTSLIDSSVWLHFNLQGGFSSISPNPLSNQPTFDDFETGEILPLEPDFQCWLERRECKKKEEE